jgi:hypothetical protein
MLWIACSVRGVQDVQCQNVMHEREYLVWVGFFWLPLNKESIGTLYLHYIGVVPLKEVIVVVEEILYGRLRSFALV